MLRPEGKKPDAKRTHCMTPFICSVGRADLTRSASKQSSVCGRGVGGGRDGRLRAKSTREPSEMMKTFLEVGLHRCIPLSKLTNTIHLPCI